MTHTTRRGYVQAFRGFFGFLAAREAVEIEALFGCRQRDPLDRFNSARHVSSEAPGLVPPPTVERVDAFFEFLRRRLETARTWAPAARDYALFRTLYHAGLRAQEAAALRAVLAPDDDYRHRRDGRSFGAQRSNSLAQLRLRVANEQLWQN